MTKIVSQPINEMSCEEARAFLLKHQSYFSNDLPEYFCFDGLLKDVDSELQGKSISSQWHRKPRNHEKVNYLFLGCVVKAR